MRNKNAVAIIVAAVMLLGASPSYAWKDDHRGYSGRFDNDRHDHGRHERSRFGMSINFVSHDYVPVFADGARYYYYNGAYYVPAGSSYVLVSSPIGAVVPSIPIDYYPVVINGVVYYVSNGTYYVYTPYGYRVVSSPVARTITESVVMSQPTTYTTTRMIEPQNQTKVAEGIGIGGIIGALTGGIVGHQMKGNKDMGAALLGGVAGATIGGILGAQVPNNNAPKSVVVERQTTVVAPPSLPVAQPAPVTSSDDVFTVNVPNNRGGFVPVLIKRSGTGYFGPQGEYYPEFPKVSQLQAMYAR
jgi:uncharacterized protein YcfJ